jgi:hypothetical protein
MAMTATVLQDLRANYPSLLDRHELRPEKYGMWNKGVMNAMNPSVGIISPDVLEKAKVSWGRNVDIPVMSLTTPATGTGLACTASGTEAVSSFVNATWASISVAFEMQPAKNFQNEIKYAAEFARKYADAIRVLAGTVNAAVDTALNTASKNAYVSAYIGAGKKYGALDINGDIQVALASRGDFFNDLVDINADEDIYPMFDVVGSTNLRGIVSQLYAQGEANDTNTQYQFTKGDYNFVFDKDVTVGTVVNTDATGYFMPAGAYGIISRNSPDCLANNTTTDGKQYGTLFDPTIGLDLDYMFYSTCADINALTGNAADVAAVNEVHQMALHYAILTPFEGNNTGVIGKFNLATA